MSSHCNSFQKGLGFYKAGNYQEALKHFNDALDVKGPHLHLVFDSRAAVHVKLGQHKEALKDAKKTIDIAPDRWQGYARAARVFLICNKPDAAQTMITMALERLKETETERRVSLLSLEADVQSLRKKLEMHRKRFTVYINHLPIEIFGEIARILVEDDHTTLINLLHVCKRWRKVVEETPQLWVKLVLTGRRPKPKTKMWIEKSKGRVRELVVNRNASMTRNWPAESLHGLCWEQLSFLRASEWDFMQYLYSIGKEGAITTWDGIELGTLTRPFRLFPGKPKSLSLQHLSMETLVVDLEKDELCDRINGLTSCSLHNCAATVGTWGRFLRANPLLERLSLERVYSADATPLPEILELDRLTSLESNYYVPMEIFTAKMPNLRSVELYYPSCDPNVFIQHLVNTLAGHLVELKLHGCILSDTRGIISLLRLSPNLRVLEITNLGVGVVSLLEALSGHHLPSSSSSSQFPSPRNDPPPDPAPILCRKLTHVNFSRCPEVQTGPLLRFIKSRLHCPSSASETSATEVAKIESLIIDSCPNVNGEWVPRIKELVPYVSCMYMTKKTKYRRLDQ